MNFFSERILEWVSVSIYLIFSIMIEALPQSSQKILAIEKVSELAAMKQDKSGKIVRDKVDLDTVVPKLSGIFICAMTQD